MKVFRSRAYVAVTAALLLASCSNSGEAEASAASAVDVEILQSRYIVEGQSLAAIRSALDNRPRRANGDSGFDGDTSWTINVPPWGTPSHCDPRTIKISVTITLSLPEVSRPEGLSETARERWLAYVAALAQHEQKHVDIIRSGVEELAHAIHTAPDCRRIYRTLRSHELRIRAENDELDRTTSHGATEGLSFPTDP